ncbi:urethanase-like [Babylonia areolata]|uniref:urethanase-like n=1 Tax=Babylonia areolata TaxID=304850 RepID=UPI003FD050D5
MAEARPTYHSTAIRPPQVEDLRELNDELKLMCTDHQLQEMADVMKGLTGAYQRVGEMVDPTVPKVKYPRTPGYRPQPEDNPCNAWAWRCDIQGAPTGKLAGKTFAIKDNTAVAGVPMRNGSKLLENYTPEFDATVVSRILDAGGRILGKSGVEDLCFSGSSITNTDAPVRNAHDQSCIAGGSSSGSAVLVALGEVDMALGGDQGGSIRIPSSYNGLVGLKATWGLVPYTGASNIEPTVDHLGPMAKTVADCALMLEVIAGYDDGRDHRQPASLTVPQYSTLIDQDVAGKKIGLLKEGFEPCTQTVQSVVREAASKLTQAGCVVEDVSIPMHIDGKAIWTVTAGQGAYKCMVESNGTGYFAKGFYPTSMQESMYRGRTAYPHDIQPLYKCVSLFFKYIDRLYGNRFYAKGQNLLCELDRRYNAALEEFDVLVMPTLPDVAAKMPPADCSFDELHTNCLNMTFNTMAFNSTGHPALTMNAGFSPPEAERKKLPIGLMIVGKKFDEVTVFQVARALEKLTAQQK